MSRHVSAVVGLLLLVWTSAAPAALAADDGVMDFAWGEELKRQREMLGPEPRLGSGGPTGGSNLGEELAAARRDYFDAYRSGKDLSQAAQRFARLLALKDEGLLWAELWLADANLAAHREQYRALHQTDGGIIPGARREFNDWVDVIKSKAGDGAPVVLQLRRLQVAGELPRYRHAYVSARNWAEFDRARVPYAPATFAWMLLQRYPIAKGPGETAPNFTAFVELFGAERVLEVARKLAPIPRDAANRCLELEPLGLQPTSPELTRRSIRATRDVRPMDPSHAYVVFLAMLARDNPKRGFLVDSYHGAWNSTDVEDWIRVRDRYRALVLGYGQQRVDDTATKCAPTGANVWHRLATDDVDGYLRFTLAAGENLGSAKAIDARIAELTAHAGEETVRRVATRVRDVELAGGDLTKLGTGRADPCAAIVSTLKPPVSNNPWYRAWARFPVGSKAVYRTYSGFEPRVNVGEVTLELVEVTPQKVVVSASRRAIDPPGGSPPVEGTFECPAALDPAAANTPGSHTRHFLGRLHYCGERIHTSSQGLARVDPTPEAMSAAGRSLRSTKRMGENKSPTILEVAWMSEEVPGGLVKLRRSETLGRPVLVTQDRLVLQSFEGKPTGDSPTVKGDLCLNCAAPLAASAGQCQTCQVLIGPDPREAQQKALDEELRRHQQEAARQRPAEVRPPARRRR